MRVQKQSDINRRGLCRDEEVTPVEEASCYLLEAVTEGNCSPSYAQFFLGKQLKQLGESAQKRGRSALNA